MITFLTALAMFCTTYAPVQPPTTVQHGLALEYGPGIFQRVYRIRQEQGLVSPGWQGGFASTPYCRNIGRVIAVSFRSPVTGQYSSARDLLVVDCAQYRDLAGQLQRGLVVEADWNTACQTGWCRDGRTTAAVYWRN